MTFSAQLKESIADLQLLSHPFYRAWTEGKLTKPELQHYAEQYRPFVEAFPRFVSALHSNCEDETARTEILENLLDEEGKTGRTKPHPQLWRDFIKALGADEGVAAGEAGMKVRDAYLKLCRASYAEGLCALYAYEYQTPAISTTKIDGLRKFYGLSDEAAFEFFRVHETADVYHAKTCEALIDAIPANEQAAALSAARGAAQSLWDFLSEAYGNKMAC